MSDNAFCSRECAFEYNDVCELEEEQEKMTEREGNYMWYYVEDWLLGYCDFNGHYYDESDYVDRVNRPEDNCDSQSDSEQDNDGDGDESKRTD